MVKVVRLILVVILLTVPSISFSQTLNGRLTTSFYVWQLHEPSTISTGHLRAYQLVQLNLGQLLDSHFSLHTYFQGSGDFSAKAKGDPRLIFYQVYGEWKNPESWFDLRLGRQPICAGINFGTIDGLQLDFRLQKHLNLQVYAGLLPTLNKSGLGSWKDGHQWGMYIATNNLKHGGLGISFMQKSRLRIEYSTPGEITVDRLLQNPTNSLQQQLIGLDAWLKPAAGLNINGRLDYQIPFKEVRRLETEVSATPSQKVEIGLDYVYRHPQIDMNSIFSVFDQKSNHEIGLRAGYRIFSRLRVFGRFTQVSYQGDHSQLLTLGFQLTQGYMGYSKRTGYGGQTDAVVGNISIPITKKLCAKLGSNFSSYRIVESEGDRKEALAFIIGLNYRPKSSLSLDVEGQTLHNRSSSSNFRLLMLSSYWFSVK